MSGTKMHGQPLVRGWLLLLGAVILAAGLFFAIGGGKLVSLGGSPYFLIAGIALVFGAASLPCARPVAACSSAPPSW